MHCITDSYVFTRVYRERVRHTVDGEIVLGSYFIVTYHVIWFMWQYFQNQVIPKLSKKIPLAPKLCEHVTFYQCKICHFKTDVNVDEVLFTVSIVPLLLQISVAWQPFFLCFFCEDSCFALVFIELYNPTPQFRLSIFKNCAKQTQRFR